MNDLNLNIKRLVDYGTTTGLIPECEKIYSRNLLLAMFKENEYSESEQTCDNENIELHVILENLCDIAVERGLIGDSITERDLFDTALMNTLTPRPSQVISKFNEEYAKSPETATEYFYKLSGDSNYIRRDRIKKDVRWKYSSKYGEMDITINLSKPEKDPKAIAAAAKAKSSSYPACQLCIENEGYAGRLDHPARQNHRIIPFELNGQYFGLQYSPYVYYNEHCIVLNSEHFPMKINLETFNRLMEFTEKFPHYFIGSNADLPIVGGSILSHDHYQGGHYTFAMERAEKISEFTIQGYEEISASIINWPMSVIRLNGSDRHRLAELADHILSKWRAYSDPECDIYSMTDDEPHNTITPIARRRGELFELDLVLRNNRTTEEYPLGLFHPHQEYHHIKKENIGLIEVMGLAVLPARLNNEMGILKECLFNGTDIASVPEIASHADWAEEIKNKYPDINNQNIDIIIQEEIGQVFVKVLEDAGVYKQDEKGREGIRRFINLL